ncbi:MAG: glycoside hydrolase family 2 protein [Candidatus Helarchaeota archaeon]
MKVSLNGIWKYKCDAEQLGEHENWHNPLFIKENWDLLSSYELPCCWNSIVEDGIPRYDRFEGFFWFFRQFELEPDSTKEYYLEFKGVNYSCKIWVNGSYLGDHQGGFVPFKLKIPQKILEKTNYLAVEVENIRKFERIPAKYFDWFNWGGIYRDIDLHILPKLHFQWIQIFTKKLGSNSAILKIKYKLTQKSKIRWQIFQNNQSIANGESKTPTKLGEFDVIIPNPALWSPISPNLYQFHAHLQDGEDSINERIGIRIIEVRQDGLYLNHKKIRIRGISLHEELLPYGRTIPKEDRLRDLKMIKKLGFNTLRTAHYSHDETLIELADELGLLILEEIPVYWYCDFANPESLKSAAYQLQSLILRDFNHPSVILWSVGNEIPVEHRNCYNFINRLMQYARKLDSSRIITYVSNRMFADKLRIKADIPCINLYLGWYLGSERNLNFILDSIYETAPNRPWLITEFGAGAQYKFHSEAYEKFSEEKQASIITHSIETFNSKDYIAGWNLWNYRDFRSALRTNKYQQGFNRKGIFSEKNEPKLIAKLIPRIMKKKVEKRRFKFLPKYSILLRPVEIALFSLGFQYLQEIFNRTLFNKFYRNKPLPKE